MKFFILFVFTFLLGSCTHHHSVRWQYLERVEAYIEQQPDSALSLLQQLSVDDCRGDAQKAYYNLLLTQALDKTYHSITDAPVASALDYYQHSEDSLRKAKAFFYQGRQYSEAEEYEAAVRCYLCALTAMKPLDEPKYKALCYSHLGNANFRQALYANSLRYYKDAVRAFEGIKDSINYTISLLDAGYSFLLLEKLDSAEHYTMQGLRMARLIDSKVEEQTAVRNLGIIYSERKEYQKALNILQSARNEVLDDDYSYFYSLSNVYVQQEQYDSAVYYAEYIIRNDSDLYGQASGYLSLYKIAKKRKDWEKALAYKEKYDLYADSIREHTQTVKLEDIQVKYNNQELAHEKELLAIHKQRNEWRLGGIILFVILLLLYILSVYKRERVKKERRILLLQQQIQENENALTTLQRDYIKRNKEIEDLSFHYVQDNKSLSTENEVMRQHLLELQQKNKEENLKLADKNKILLDELKKYKDIKTESGKHYETITFIIQLLDNPGAARALTPEELDAMEYFVIRLFGPMFQSRVEAVRLSATERKLWCLLQLGFPHASIAAFLCITPQSVSRAKLRMKKKIQEFMVNDVDKLYL
ncbi:tetratricopeptide repeat protein [Phocaeicola sp.]